MRDPLDDIEAILADICGKGDPDHLSAAEGLHDKQPAADFHHISTPDDTSPGKSALDTLLHEINGEENEISRSSPKRRRSQLKNPHQVAPKKKRTLLKPTKPIRRARQRKGASKKIDTTARSAQRPHRGPDMLDGPALATNEDAKEMLSDDDADNQFLQQMKSLAEQKLQVCCTLLFFTSGNLSSQNASYRSNCWYFDVRP